MIRILMASVKSNNISSVKEFNLISLLVYSTWPHCLSDPVVFHSFVFIFGTFSCRGCFQRNMESSRFLHAVFQIIPSHRYCFLFTFCFLFACFPCHPSSSLLRLFTSVKGMIQRAIILLLGNKVFCGDINIDINRQRLTCHLIRIQVARKHCSKSHHHLNCVERGNSR